jgi:hypothetical protein
MAEPTKPQSWIGCLLTATLFVLLFVMCSLIVELPRSAPCASHADEVVTLSVGNTKIKLPESGCWTAWYQKPVSGHDIGWDNDGVEWIQRRFADGSADPEPIYDRPDINLSHERVIESVRFKTAGDRTVFVIIKVSKS